MTERLRETAVVAYPYGEAGIRPRFDNCLTRLKDFDAEYCKRLSHPHWKLMVGSSHIAMNRNKIVRAFLEDTDCDWLFFVDTDQTFDPNILERLIMSADPVERPIVSALIMAYRPERDLPVTPACALLTEDGRFAYPTMIPNVRYWSCIPGTGAIVIHRSVLEAMGDKYQDTTFPWFSYLASPPPEVRSSKFQLVDHNIGEDYSFMLRAIQLGFDPVVDTTIEAGHLKEVELTSADFWRQLRPEQFPAKTFVVIPVKDRRDYTADLLHQLEGQGGFDEVFVFDNGSNRETRNWLDTQSVATVFDADGLGIHEMWNQGVEAALARWPRCNVVFLNNDLRLGDNTIAGLTEVLRAHDDLVVASPNYDKRDGDPIQRTTQIAADRYDGTGGVAGFAFAVKGEWFQAGYRFPEDCKWWYGDNDLVLAVTASGHGCAITRDVHVEHLDGGGGTAGDWADPAWEKQLAADREAFMARWGAVEVPA